MRGRQALVTIWESRLLLQLDRGAGGSRILLVVQGLNWAVCGAGFGVHSAKL